MTDEERKEAHRQADRKYRMTHKEQEAEKHHNWYVNHKAEAKAYQDKYRSEHLEEKREYQKEWRKKTNFTEKQKEYRKTKTGRALALSAAYNSYDTNRFSSNNTVTKTWIINNLFSGQHCVYCGDGDWRHLGADRIDNSKPHTEDNILCSCGICNVEREILGMSVENFKTYRNNNPLPKWKDSDFD